MSYEDENKFLKMVIEMQVSRIADQKVTIKELRIMVDELRSLKANLEETLEEFRRQFFGVRSEKTSVSKKEDEKKIVQVKGYTATRKKKATREELYANLPVREILYTVAEEERRCDWCNARMIFLNAPTFVREELRITPAKVERIRYMQEVLICLECKKDKDGFFKKAALLSALFPNSRVSSSSVAYTMFHKCFMGLSYYRQESLLDQLGAKIPRGTLANCCSIASRDYLYTIYELLHKELIHVRLFMQMKQYVRCCVKTEKPHNLLPICGFIDQGLTDFFSVTAIRTITRWKMFFLSAAWLTAEESFMKHFQQKGRKA